MTDAELINAIQGELSILASASEWGLTMLTGYLLIAYVIGSNLTRFQVTFVNIVFGLLCAGQGFSTRTSSTIVNNFMRQLHAQNPELAYQFGHSDINVSGTVWIRPILAALVIVGAYIFMWNIRHPKTE